MGNLSKTRFSIYATRSKYRKRIVSALRYVGTGGGNYYTILESRILRCETGVGGLSIFDLPDQMNSAKYKNPKLKHQKDDLINAANKYLSVRGKFGVIDARITPKRYVNRRNFKISVGPDVVWNVPRGRVSVAFYQDKMDETRLNKKKAEFIAALVGMSHELPSSAGTIVIDLQTGEFFECEDDGSILGPNIEVFCEEIDAELS